MRKKILELVKKWGRQNGKTYFLDVNSIEGVAFSGNPKSEYNSHCIDCCDIDDDGDCYVIFTDDSDKWYLEDFNQHELKQIYEIITKTLAF